MRTSVILNLKGGVAKTATAVNVAAILASDYKQRVLLVDADSQCNTTEFFGCDPGYGNLAEVLRQKSGGAAFAVSSIMHTNFPGIDLLAGDDSLMDLDLTKVELQSVQTAVLRDMVQLLEQKNSYDVCLVDCPPAFNAASAAALMAADEVIIPIKLDAFSLRGMTNLIRQIHNMRAINPKLKLAGCLPTMWYRSDTVEQGERLLQEQAPVHVFASHIRRSPKVDESTWTGEPVVSWSPRPAAAQDYRAFVAEFLEEGAAK